MTKIKIMLAACAVTLGMNAQAQEMTVDTIVANYIENIGGQDAIDELETLTYIGSVNAQGMDIPIKMINTNEGKQALTIELQGQEMTQYAFDGKTMWSTNFMTMQPEEGTAEDAANMALDNNDFLDPIFGYKEKGYTAEYMGEETKDGTSTYKVMLKTEPEMVDGKEVESIAYYYFDKDNFVPIIIETTMTSGPAAGQTSAISMSDYREVDGVMFAHSMDQGGQPIVIKEILINEEIDESVFTMPKKN